MRATSNTIERQLSEIERRDRSRGYASHSLKKAARWVVALARIASGRNSVATLNDHLLKDIGLRRVQTRDESWMTDY